MGPNNGVINNGLRGPYPARRCADGPLEQVGMGGPSSNATESFLLPFAQPMLATRWQMAAARQSR